MYHQQSQQKYIRTVMGIPFPEAVEVAVPERQSKEDRAEGVLPAKHDHPRTALQKEGRLE